MMADPTTALTLIGLLILLLMLRIPVAAALLLVAGAGQVWVAGWPSLLAQLKTGPFWRFSTFDLAVVPLFLLMGHLASHTGLSGSLFAAARAWTSGRRGGLALASVGACAGFGAVCGSSLATAATMGRTALPELRASGYAPGLAGGVLAAGGTLGILIPPSVALVLYGLLTEANIVALFQAALIPGLVAVAGHALAVAWLARRRPQAMPAGAAVPWRHRLGPTGRAWPALALFVVVIGGIYGGLFTPTEAAAVGVVAVLGLALARGRLSRLALRDSLVATAGATAMIFLVLLGADLFNGVLALTGLPAAAATWAEGSGWPPLLLLVGLLLLYLLLGCVMDSLSMILLTVPLFWPVLAGLDFGLPVDDLRLWFGILAVMVVEIGLITPPLGLNVFVIQSLAPDIPLSALFRGVLPFVVADALRVALLVAVPALTLMLPRLLGSL